MRDLKNDRTLGVSVSTLGAQGNGDSLHPSISSNGRFVAFESNATNLVAGETNGKEGVFVRDLLTRTTRLVSVGLSGAPANADSQAPSVSADGRFVAFESRASNLVAGSIDDHENVFVRDLHAGTTQLVSEPYAGGQPNGDSIHPAIAADGRYVAFSSDASNLVAGDTNGTSDVFVRDLRAHQTVRVSVSSSGAQGNAGSSGPSISREGRLVAFASDASNLVPDDADGKRQIFVHDLRTGETQLVSAAPRDQATNGESRHATISADGRFVGFISDASNLTSQPTGGLTNVFVRDLLGAVTKLISVAPTGTSANANSIHAAISGNGRFITFESLASNLVVPPTNGTRDVFVTGPLSWR